MKDNLTLEDKLEEVQELANRRDKIKTYFDAPNRKLEVHMAGTYKTIYLEMEEKGLKERIDDYFKTELEKADKRLNELLK